MPVRSPHYILRPALQLNDIPLAVPCIDKGRLTSVLVFRPYDLSHLTAAIFQQKLQCAFHIIHLKCKVRYPTFIQAAAVILHLVIEKISSVG